VLSAASEPYEKELKAALRAHEFKKAAEIIEQYPSLKDSDVIFSANWFEAASFLVEQGFDPLIKTDQLKRTTLMAVVRSDEFKASEYFLRKGVNVNAKDIYGHTALYFSVGSRDGRLISLLLKNGAYPDSQNYVGETPLMVAVKYFDTEAISLLIASGANKGLRNANSETAYDLAKVSEHNFPENIISLLKIQD
jgi:ankyrin repeat protein